MAEKRGTISRLPPVFWESTRVGLIVVNPNAGKKDPKAYASEQFAWELLKHRKPHDLAPWAQSPLEALSTLLQQCCPGYQLLLGARFDAKSLLGAADHVADLAFVHGVWRYSQALKHSKEVFPPGIYQWPPPEALPGSRASSSTAGAGPIAVSSTAGPSSAGSAPSARASSASASAAAPRRGLPPR